MVYQMIGMIVQALLLEQKLMVGVVQMPKTTATEAAATEVAVEAVEAVEPLMPTMTVL